MTEIFYTAGQQGPVGPPARLCRFATIAALPSYTATAYTLTATANGAFATTDGIAPAIGDLVFVKNETGGNAKNNGPYRIVALGSVSDPWSLSRATDVALDVIGVRLGTTNGGKLWYLSTSGTIVLGTTALTFQSLVGGSGGGTPSDATPQDVAAAGAAGTATEYSRGDHVHAHGNQSGGTLHAAATTSTAGFLSAADKTKLDGIATSAAALTSTAPVDVTKASAAVGAATTAARADHKHDISTAAAVSLSVGGSNAEGTATSLARSDHTHALPAFGTTSGTFLEGNNDALYVKLAGAQTITGAKTFSDATSPIISAKIGPASGQQHTIPAVASDTIALLAATQTLTNKTLTSPVINVGSDAHGDVYYRNSGGAFTRLAPGTSGQVFTTQGPGADPIWATAAGGSPFVVDDATNNGITDVIAVRHTTSGTAAAGIGAGILLQTEDTGGSIQDTGRIAGILTTATSGSEASAMTFSLWGSGALSEKMRLGSDGGLVIGSTAAAGGVGLAIPNGASIWARNNTNNGWHQVFIMNNTRPEFGDANVGNMFRGNSIQLYSLSSLIVYAGGTPVATFPASPTSVQWGGNDATATPSDWLHRGANATGTNIAGAVNRYRAPLGTGNAATGIFRIEGGIPQASGTTQHVVATLADLAYSGTDDDTALLLRTRKGGVEAVERVTIGTTDSGGTGFRVLRVPN